MALKVLFVEDLLLDVELAVVELERAGLEAAVRRVETEDDFIRELNEFEPDVILSDFTMPRFDGFMALGLAQKQSPDTPLIFVSGTIGEDTAVESLKRGATDYILKSNLRRLPAAVRRAMAEVEELRARRALENDLRESERRYRMLFDSHPHPMWVYDITTLRFLEVNDMAVARYGFSRDEFLAMSIKDIRPQHDVARLLDLVAQPIPAVLAVHSWQHRTKGGELIEVDISSHELVFEGRAARAVVAFDITERARAQERLRQSESNLAAAQRLAHLGSWELDLGDLGNVNRNQLRWSDEVFRIFGYEPGEIEVSNENFLRAVHPDDRALIEEAVAASIRTRQPYELVHRIILPDGKERFVHERSEVICEDNSGRLVKMMGTVQDVTERKRAEQRLVQSEAKFRDLIEHAPDGIYLCDRRGNFLMANSLGCQLLGYREAELIGLNGEVTYLQEELDLRLERLGQIHRGQELHFERMVKRKDGSVFPAAISLKMLDDDRMQSIFHDITERKLQEDKIARLSRIHAVLSGINSAIVRVRDPKELYQEACRIAVEQGRLVMAWIGLVDKNSLRVEPVAWAGHESGFLNSAARLSLDENTAEGQGVAGRAIRSKLPIVTNDFASDPHIVFKEETLARGYRAGVVLPLVVGEDAVGLFSLYASEAGFFDDEEVKLLTELAADISFSLEHIQQEKRLHHLAYYDALTGLANRSLLQDRLLQAMHFADRFQLNVTVLVVNLDRFKLVNDTLGHAAGDDLLKVAGGRIVACVRDIDTVARFGADEFIVVLAGTEQDGDSAAQIAQRIFEAFAEPVGLAGRELFITCSVGVAIYPRDATHEDTLLKKAAAALSRAKGDGGNNVQFYTPETGTPARERLSLESALRRALERDEFVLHYQPQVDLRTGQVIGLEALIRWECGELGMVPPMQFISVAEEIGLILPIGEWVLRTAARQNKAWQNECLASIRIAVNLSAQQFRQKDLPRRIERILADTGLESRFLEVELTESMLMREVESAVDMMAQLRRLGVQISLDDFGTGYSSLSHLKRFPIDTLKIDRSFVREVTSDPDSAAIADAIIAMAHSLRLIVLAEGVETEGQLAFLREHHCDQMQGYLFSKPLPGDELVQLLREKRSLPSRSSSDDTATILLLDDEPNVLAALRQLLQDQGYQILTADTPDAAFELLAQHRVQVIVTDQRMPAMTSTEFFGRVKDLHPDIVRIMLSGYSETKAVTEAINKGTVHKVLSKPWDDEAFRAVVKDAFQRFGEQKQQE